MLCWCDALRAKLYTAADAVLQLIQYHTQHLIEFHMKLLWFIFRVWEWNQTERWRFADSVFEKPVLRFVERVWRKLPVAVCAFESIIITSQIKSALYRVHVYPSLRGREVDRIPKNTSTSLSFKSHHPALFTASSAVSHLRWPTRACDSFLICLIAQRAVQFIICCLVRCSTLSRFHSVVRVCTRYSAPLCCVLCCFEFYPSSIISHRVCVRSILFDMLVFKNNSHYDSAGYLPRKFPCP